LSGKREVFRGEEARTPDNTILGREVYTEGAVASGTPADARVARER
jgi:hypothetical protein